MEKKAQDILSEFEASDKAAWANAVKQSLRKQEELNALQHVRAEGISMVALYDAEDIKNLPFVGAEPGVYPYCSGFPGFEQSVLRQRIHTEKHMLANQQAEEALKNGADEIEFVGDSIGNEREFGTLLLGLNPTQNPLHFHFDESNNALLFILAAEWEAKGYDLNKVKGSVYFSPFDRLLATGNYDYSESETARLLKANLDCVIEQMPQMKALSVNGLRFANAGGGEVSEMAFSLAMAVEYLKMLEEQGLEPNKVIPHLQFHLSAGPDYLTNIAKLRAFRMLWANVADAWEIDVFPHIHMSPSEFNLSIYDRHTNMLRLTSAAMSAMLGGAGSFTAIPFNERIELPDAFAYRNARNIWNVLKQEAYMDRVQDPAAGSYFLEMLTSKLCEAAWDLFREVEKKGGFLASLENKFIQGSIEKNYNDKLEAFRKGEYVVVGTNKYPDQQEKLSGKISKLVQKPDMKEQFRVMPLPARFITESLDESRLKSETQQLREELASNEEEE